VEKPQKDFPDEEEAKSFTSVLIPLLSQAMHLKSQDISDAGAETRSILMSVLHILNKRRGKESLESVFKGILDRIAEDPHVDVTSLILPASEKPL
jgi:hypothetical protein